MIYSCKNLLHHLYPSRVLLDRWIPPQEFLRPGLLKHGCVSFALEASILAFTDNPQVFTSIVGSVPVFVVNILTIAFPDPTRLS